MDWIELTKVNGEVDAQLVAGSLENEGIPTRLQKSSGEWRYGAADAFVLIAIYVPGDRIDEARDLLDHPTGQEAAGFDIDQTFRADVSDASEDPAADPFFRSRPLRWWVAALILVGLIVAFTQLEVLELLR